MLAFGVAGNATFRALFSTFGAQWQHVSTVTTPICANVGDGLETMRDAMVELVFVSVLVGICLGDALGNHLCKALSVAGVLTVFTLIAAVDHELATQSTAHNVVKLLFDELMAVHFMDFLSSLSDSTSTTQLVQGTTVGSLTHKVDSKQHFTRGLYIKPRLDAVLRRLDMGGLLRDNL